MILKIKNIIIKSLDVDVSELNKEYDLLYLLYNDYMEFAEVIFQIEKEFNINIQDEDCLNLKNTKDIISYIGDKIS